MQYNELKNKHGGMAVDTSYEDKMYRQIEKSLSNNINDKLFVPIEMMNKAEPSASEDKQEVDYPVFEYREEGPRLSRAELIIQAREACLRQMNAMESSGKIYDNYGGAPDSVNSFHGRKRISRVERLFNEEEEEAPPDELASYKSLIIRTVCAAVIFVSVFIIDKIKVDWGAFSYETIHRYVTGNNQLKVLEELLVSWLK